MLLYHGTTTANLNLIMPAQATGAPAAHRNVTDIRYAYATDDPRWAWAYAEMAWGTFDTGIPRVYEVEPLGALEDDPSHDEHGRSRGNFTGDRRSQAGFRVVRELPWPADFGDPADWA
jgi:hypothetical protein